MGEQGKVMEGPQRMLTALEVKEVLGFGINKTYQLINSQGFPKIKIGRQYLIPENEFNKWIEKYCYKKYIL